MAVDLADLIEPLKRETSPPGTNLFPDAVDDDWLGQLQDSFWEAKLEGFFSGYTLVDEFISPDDSTADDLGRDWQQLIVIFAGIRAVRMKLMNTNTSFRAQAGPVEFEVANSANLLNEILKELNAKIDRLLTQLSSLGAIPDYYINGLIARSCSIAIGDEHWWG